MAQRENTGRGKTGRMGPEGRREARPVINDKGVPCDKLEFLS
jgi:hypothetical protein